MRDKTIAWVSSPRAMAGALSMPLRWNEPGPVYPTDVTLLTVPQRRQQVGDLWSGLLDAKHHLRVLLERSQG